MNGILRVVSAVGLAAFTSWFVLCALAPQWLERRARGYVTDSIRREIVRKYPQLGELGSAGGLKADLRERAARATGLAESGTPDVIAMWLSTLCKHDCPDHSEIATAVRGFLVERVR